MQRLKRLKRSQKLPEKKKAPAWLRFLKEITNWFAIMLWVGSILCIIVYIVQPAGNLPNLYLAFVLIFVIILPNRIFFPKSFHEMNVANF